MYPTLVIRGTGLYELWKAGLYRNYAPDRLVDLVARYARDDFFCVVCAGLLLFMCVFYQKKRRQ